jgi:hypothetical protein
MENYFVMGSMGYIQTGSFILGNKQNQEGPSQKGRVRPSTTTL